MSRSFKSLININSKSLYLEKKYDADVIVIYIVKYSMILHDQTSAFAYYGMPFFTLIEFRNHTRRRDRTSPAGRRHGDFLSLTGGGGPSARFISVSTGPTWEQKPPTDDTQLHTATWGPPRAVPRVGGVPVWGLWSYERMDRC